MILAWSAGIYGIACGAASAAAGLDLAQTLVLSALMYSGGSHFAFVAVIGAGGSAYTGMAGALLLAVRNTLYSLRLRSVLRVGGVRRLVAAHGVSDETTAMAVAQASAPMSRLAFWVTAATLFLAWNVAVVAGALLTGGLSGAALAALDAVVPAAFLALLWPRLRGSADQRWSAAGAVVVAVATIPLLPPGLPVILSVLAPIVVLMIQRRRSR